MTTHPPLAGWARAVRQTLTRHRRWLVLALPFVALGLLVLAFGILAGDRFLSWTNAKFIVQQSAVIAIPAFGATLVIIAGSIDLSVGAVMAFTGMLAAKVAEDHGLAGGLVGAIAAGAAIGAVNGAVVTWLKVPSFIVTLGMLSVVGGFTLVYSDNQAVPVSPQIQNVSGMPEILFVLLGLLIVSSLLLSRTTLGRYVVAIGGDERVARASGVAINRVKIAVFGFAGLMAGIGGFVLDGRVGAATPSAGTGFELSVIAAVVIGGTPLTGGYGSMFSTLAGALVINTLLNGLVIMNVAPEWQQIASGLILVAAVFISLERGKSIIK
jgi:ribose/xylose/arabinose/galactoside ABC-type transport system permease subunit